MIVDAMDYLIVAFKRHNDYDNIILNVSYTALLLIAKHYNLTLDQLTASNWEKLKPGSERGDEWMKARIQTDYANRGKIGLK
jgi:hypothetical protein